LHEENLASQVEASAMWAMAVALTLGAVGVVAAGSSFWRRGRRPDLGWMSQAWLVEYHAARR
jgi:hypothetical protein